MKHFNKDIHLYAIFLCIGISLPLLIFFIKDITLVGMGEESIGYRYFYSLRILYEKSNAPILPQGHLVSIIHILLQFLLTKFGSPINDLTQRINLFSYIASTIPIVLVGICYYWSVNILDNKKIKFLLSFLSLVVCYQLRVGSGYHLVIPDYYLWVLPLAFVAFGFIVREDNNPGYIFQKKYLYAMYVAACYTIKATYLILPMCVFFYTLTNLKTINYLPLIFLKCIKPSLKIAAITLINIFMIFFIYYKGNLIDSLHHFSIKYYSQFFDLGSPGYINWLRNMLIWRNFDICMVTALFPYALFLLLFFTRNKKFIMVLLFLACSACWIAYKRPYPPTYVETSVYTILGLILIFYKYSQKIDYFYSKFLNHLKFDFIIISLILLSTLFVNNFFKNFYDAYLVANKAEVALKAYLSRFPGKTLYVITSNHYRPITIDSAIFKGGMDLNNNIWPASKLISSFVTDRSYIVSKFNPNLDLGDYSKLVFVASENAINEQIKNIHEIYGINYSNYNCNFYYKLGIGGVNWFLPYVKSDIPTNSFYFPSDANIPRVMVACTAISNA